jgi:hypothetical protein
MSLYYLGEMQRATQILKSVLAYYDKFDFEKLKI